MLRPLVVIVALFPVACGPPPAPSAGPSPAPSPVPATDGPAVPAAAAAPAKPEVSITAERISRPSRLATLPPLSDQQFRVHMVDVGTGLSILIEHPGFKLLYDGGSGDDKRGISGRGTRTKNRNRLVAYLYAAFGITGPTKCRPEGDGASENPSPDIRIILSHVVLSHAHDDHGSLLDDVFACYSVEHYWEPGHVNDAAFYRDLWTQIAAHTDTVIHTNRPLPDDNTLSIKGTSIEVNNPWRPTDEPEVVPLADDASMAILHVDGADHHDHNENSLVVMLDVRGAKLLLVGDAESGPRKDPSEPVGGIEKFLIETYPDALDADILQVGHHGSLTSSRTAFLQAVSPEHALVSAGPKKYGSVVLPDAAVIEALQAVGATVYRTDTHDAGGCDETDKIGTDDDRPGGCDNWVLTVTVK